MSSFVKRVAEGMERSGLSLRQVARDAELDPSFLSKVLAGKRTPPSDEKALRRLAKVIGIDPDLLIVSTGLIPSELQGVLEDSDLLKSLKDGKVRPVRPKAEPPLWPARRPPELSEDLL